MSEVAFQTKYRKEFIAGFEKRQSLVRRTVTVETEINGNQATFLVANSGGATAVSRGVNGDIPTRADNLNQYTAVLQEWHDVPERTNFNIYASQGDGRRIMQQTSMAVMNRKIDSDIYSALTGASVTWDGTSNHTTVTLQKIARAKTILANAFADEDEPFALITPAFHGYMMTTKALNDTTSTEGSLMDAFGSTDFITGSKFEGVSKSRAFNWYGVNWIVDAGNDTGDGAGGSEVECFMFSRAAMGHACDMERISTRVGYDEKNDKSWARCSAYMGSKLLQNSGIVKMNHNDSALS